MLLIVGDSVSLSGQSNVTMSPAPALYRNRMPLSRTRLSPPRSSPDVPRQPPENDATKRTRSTPQHAAQIAYGPYATVGPYETVDHQLNSTAVGPAQDYEWPPLPALGPVVVVALQKGPELHRRTRHAARTVRGPRTGGDAFARQGEFMIFSSVREVNPLHQSSCRSGPSMQMQTQCRSCVVRSMAVGDYQQAEVVAAIRHSALCPPNPHAHWEP